MRYTFYEAFKIMTNYFDSIRDEESPRMGECNCHDVKCDNCMLHQKYPTKCGYGMMPSDDDLTILEEILKQNKKENEENV